MPADRGIRPAGDSSGNHAGFRERMPFAPMGELGRSSQYIARWVRNVGRLMLWRAGCRAVWDRPVVVEETVNRSEVTAVEK